MQVLVVLAVPAYFCAGLVDAFNLNQCILHLFLRGLVGCFGLEGDTPVMFLQNYGPWFNWNGTVLHLFLRGCCQALV